MRFVRGMGGVALWILASVVSLVALILCVTILLLPVGIPLLMLGRKLFGQAIRLFMPRGALHPVETSRKASKSAAKDVADGLGKKLSSVPRPDGKLARKRVKKGKKKVKKVAHA